MELAKVPPCEGFTSAQFAHTASSAPQVWFMLLLKVFVLAIVQGFAELLPISSSAHVIIAEKLMGLDPSSPQMTFLLVTLHTGTMFSVIAFFWPRWKIAYFSSAKALKRFAILIGWAMLVTMIVAAALKKLVEETFFRGTPKSEIEQLFSHLELIAPALGAVGILILIAGWIETRPDGVRRSVSSDDGSVSLYQAGWMGAVQGLAIPFRGFSRSGSTISAGMLVGTTKELAERFSFAMAVAMTPALLGIEGSRLHKASKLSVMTSNHMSLRDSVGLSLIGLLVSFFAGLCALKWLNTWLESGRWYLFGLYCLFASIIVYYLHTRGY